MINCVVAELEGLTMLLLKLDVQSVSSTSDCQGISLRKRMLI